jgi:hypothetical protein
MSHREVLQTIRAKFVFIALEWAPKVRQAVKAQISSKGEKSYESVSKKVHERVQGSRRATA